MNLAAHLKVSAAGLPDRTAVVLSYSTSLQGNLDHARIPIKVRALCPDVVGTDMVTSLAKDPGAALLFSGPKPCQPMTSPVTGHLMTYRRGPSVCVSGRKRHALA